jgi:hypothetical protein
MTVRKLMPCLCVLAVVLSWSQAGEPPAAKKEKDYTALSQLIQQSVVKQMPKVYKNETGWGQTVPIPPEGLRLMRRRQTVPVGDHLELPHGHWRKTRIWMDDPNRDLNIKVLDLRPAGDKSYRITLDIDASLHGATEVEQWQKGLLVIDLTGEADTRVGILLDCDVALSLGKGFPPEVKVEPKVTNLTVDLKDFNLKHVEGRRTRIAVALDGEAAQNLGKEFKGVLQDMIRSAEPQVIERANEAIARSLREGKGTFSAMELMKALSKNAK